jgi:hypothetical protein
MSMTEHDDIARRLHEAVETTAPRDDDIGRIATKARRRRAVRWTATTGATAVIVFVAAVTALGLVRRYDRPNRIELADGPTATQGEGEGERQRAGGRGSEGTTAPVQPAAPVEQQALPRSPLDARWGAFSASTGDQLLIWGGYAWAGDDGEEGPRSDGATYDGTRWAELPESPLRARARTSGVAAWTGDELWIVGGLGGDDGRTPMRDAAAYRPATRTWRRLPSVPEPISAGAWAGAQLVVVAEPTDGPQTIYALAVDGERWEKIGALSPDTSAVANSDLHVLGSGNQVVIAGLGDIRVLGSDEERTLQDVPLPDDADTLPNVRGAVADATSIVVLLPDGTYRYDLDRGAWSRIAGGLDPDPPQAIPLVRTDGGALVAVDVVNGRIHTLSGDDGWTSLTAMDGSRVDATVGVVGDQIVIWGGMGSEQPGAEEGARLRASPAG